VKIAISTDGDFVSGHFGRCPSFTIVNIEDDQVVNKETIANPGHHPGYLPEFLHDLGVNCIVAGGMGQKARVLFDEKGIQAIVGVAGAIDDVVNKLARGRLEGGSNTCVPESGKGYGVDKSVCDYE